MIEMMAAHLNMCASILNDRVTAVHPVDKREAKHGNKCRVWFLRAQEAHNGLHVRLQFSDRPQRHDPRHADF